MDVILRACFRFGVLLSAVGVGCVFFAMTDVMLGFIQLGLITLHLVVSMWTANKPTSYNAYRECFIDIMGDLAGYTVLLLCIFAWFMLPRFVILPVTAWQYWSTAAFLVVMCLITLFEMVVTIRSCLIALERQNPISLAQPLS